MILDRKQLLSYLVFLCISLFLQISARTQISAGGPDFSSFYAAGEIVRSGNGAHLYNFETQSQAQRQFSYRQGPLLFGHGPFETIIYAPLSLLSFKQAYFLWWLCNQLLVLATLCLMARSFAGIQILLPYWILALAFFVPLQGALLQGQDSVLTLFLLTVCLVRLTDGHYASAGAILALSLYKPQLIFPIFLILAVGLSWRFVWGFIAGTLGVAVTSVILIGWDGLTSLPRFLVWFNALPIRLSGADPLRMANIRGVLLQSGVNVSSTTIALVSASLLLLTIAATKNYSHGAALRTRFVLAICFAILTSYHILLHDLTLLILPFLLAIHELAAAPIVKLQTIFATLAIAMLMVFPSMGLDPRLTFLGVTLFTLVYWAEMRRRGNLLSLPDELSQTPSS